MEKYTILFCRMVYNETVVLLNLTTSHCYRVKGASR